jgi:glucose/arabinose dehydrogenase
LFFRARAGVQARMCVRVVETSEMTSAGVRFVRVGAALLVLWLLLLPAGCVRGPVLLSEAEQRPIDRKLVEYPSGFELRPYVRNLTAPSAIAFDTDGAILIAEGGAGGSDIRILGFRRDGSYFQIYPYGRQVPFGIVRTGFTIYGPIGGMVADRGKVYVSHRDANRRGVITAFDYDGNHQTVVADLPAQGDYGVTDLAIARDGRLFFGIGAASNSGVVGLDNWLWVRRYGEVSDKSWVDLKLLGYRFDTRNPRAGLFGGDDIAVTAPFQPFGVSNQTRVHHVSNGKPTAAIYSVSPTGGDLRVEAHGIRYPRGLAFNEYGRLYFTNDGMELRGTRPVKDDPDALLRLVPGTYYGWPDYSTDLQPISETRFQPPVELVIKTGYPDIGFLVDHSASGLLRPDRNTLMQATFPPLSGAAKMEFVPDSGPFNDYRGSAIVALAGDRAPFATSGYKLTSPVGYKVVRVDVDNHQVKDFIRNTENVPASRQQKLEGDALERPIDVKFGPDGAMYVLDFGQLQLKKDGREKVAPRTGRIFKLVPVSERPAGAAGTQPD